jgi:hypothetical protein
VRLVVIEAVAGKARPGVGEIVDQGEGLGELAAEPVAGVGWARRVAGQPGEEDRRHVTMAAGRVGRHHDGRGNRCGTQQFQHAGFAFGGVVGVIGLPARPGPSS